jgi:tripartite-type tricarboxylate transporter receptor subunit TctC
MTDLLSGQIQLMFESVGVSLPPVQAGLLRPLGVTSSERIAELPDLPTIAESGYPGYRVSVWYGIATAIGMPVEAARMFGASINRALGDEELRASLTKAGFAPLKPRSEVELKQFVDADKSSWLNEVKKLNFSLD